MLAQARTLSPVSFERGRRGSKQLFFGAASGGEWSARVGFVDGGRSALPLRSGAALGERVVWADRFAADEEDDEEEGGAPNDGGRSQRSNRGWPFPAGVAAARRARPTCASCSANSFAQDLECVDSVLPRMSAQEP